MNGTKLILILLISLSTMHLGAQNRWSLNSCISYAMQNNLNLVLTDLDEANLKLDARQSKLNLLPVVSASIGAGHSVGRSVDISTNTYVDEPKFSNSTRIETSMTLFNGFVLQNSIAYYKYKRQEASFKSVEQQDNLAFRIMEVYYNIIYYTCLVDIVKAQLEASNYSLKRVNVQIASGFRAKTDLAEIEASVASEELLLTQTENALDDEKLNLAQLMNLPDNDLSGFVCDTNDVDIRPILVVDADQLFNEFVLISSKVQQAEAQLAAAKKSRQIVYGQFLPSLSLSAGISSHYTDTYLDKLDNVVSYRDQLDYTLNKYVGVSLSIPIFNRNRARTNLHKLRNNFDYTATQLQIIKETLRYNLNKNVHNMQGLYREYIQTEKKVEADNAAYHIAQRKYEEGIVDVIEFLTVKNRLIKSQSDLLNVGLQWKIKDRTIQFYKGERFWEM